MKFGFHGQTIFILHGYQASFFLELFRFLIALSLRFLAQPLHIRNYSVARSSSKKFAIEKKIYEFARQRKIIALIGHTHRPLFESLSKRDSLKFHIEQLCRLYPRADGQEKAILEKQIKQAREELQDLVHRKEGAADSGSLYASEPLVPCLFNSGCAIGKKGITALELEAGSIRLVYWFDSEREPRHFESRGSPPEALAGTPYCRLVLQEEPLDYLFTRIRLLA